MPHLAKPQKLSLLPTQSAWLIRWSICCYCRFREAGTIDHGGPVAMYVRAQVFIRGNLRDPDLSIDQIPRHWAAPRYLHMLFSDRA